MCFWYNSQKETDIMFTEVRNQFNIWITQNIIFIKTTTIRRRRMIHVIRDICVTNLFLQEVAEHASASHAIFFQSFGYLTLSVSTSGDILPCKPLGWFCERQPAGKPFGKVDFSVRLNGFIAYRYLQEKFQFSVAVAGIETLWLGLGTKTCWLGLEKDGKDCCRSSLLFHNAV